tara:strand:+ start:225 stop:788 length:564 start_codon:yes stop_codon:yes gene_type:complete
MVIFNYKMTKYNLSKVYKIVSSEGDQIYIGSTCQKLSSRMSRHRTDFRANRGTASGKLFEMYGIETCKIILIEAYKCDNSDELRKREQFHIDTITCINKQKAYVSEEDSKKYIADYSKKYKNDHKEAITEYNRKYMREYREKKRQKHIKHMDYNFVSEWSPVPIYEKEILDVQKIQNIIDLYFRGTQ